MLAPEPVAEWARKEPQASHIATAERLEAQGFTAAEQAESLLTLALTMQNEIHGPRAVAARLFALAQKFAGEADRADQEARNAVIN